MESNPAKPEYIHTLLAEFRRMPGNTGILRRNDRMLAAALYDRGVPLLAVQNALILAAARRILRSPGAPPLQPVRSLHYLLPVIDEVLHVPAAQNYYRYLQLKLDAALKSK